MFAALVLRAMALEQTAKGIERVSPRDRGVASRLGMEPDSPELAAAERYLVLEDYIRPSSPDHKDGPFIITEFGWNDLGYELSPEGWRRKTFLEKAVRGLGKARCDVSGGKGVRLEGARKRFYLPDCREEEFSEAQGLKGIRRAGITPDSFLALSRARFRPGGLRRW